MKILTPSQIKAVDAYTIEHEPVTSVDLMDRAAMSCTCWLTERFDRHWKIMVFAGPGNNGGDGLTIARFLLRMGYQVSVYMLTDSKHLSPDALINYQRLDDCKPVVLNGSNFPDIWPSTLVIDAMFGVGLSRPLDGLAALTVAHINKSGAEVISIDMPSGLFCDDNEKNNPDAVIRANHTLTFQQPKLSFFFAGNDLYTGKWEVRDICLSQESIRKQSSKIFALCDHEITRWMEPRNKFAHKGDFGHACIIAGKHGMMGACVLATKACLRAGAGLVTAHIPKKECAIMQISAPEALVSLDSHPVSFSQLPDLSIYSAIAVGPGIGKSPETGHALLALLHLASVRRTGVPDKIVLDADALNILSENPEWLSLLPPNSIITPHPKEFDRLAGNSSSGYQRHLKQIEMACRYAIIIVLKGAYTSIATPDGSCFFNTTGNPGMATAGSGDVLTGIIVSLLAQGWTPFRAACAGVWLHGKAGDEAAGETGQQALTASDIVGNIGRVLKKYVEQDITVKTQLDLE